VLAGNDALMDAFYTDVRADLAKWRADRGVPADPMAAYRASGYAEQVAAERKLLAIPADGGEAGKLAKGYQNASLGEVLVKREGGKTVFDLGEWKSEMASKTNPDGTISFVTLRPGLLGFEFVVGAKDGKRTLTVRDGQHDYVFLEK